MNRTRLAPVLAAAAALAGGFHAHGNDPQLPPDTAFPWQGQLAFDGDPYEGMADLAFRLHETAEGWTQVGSDIYLDDHLVTEGRLALELDFGLDVFDGQDRWLEIEIDGTTLSPRQPILPVPYALTAQRALSVDLDWDQLAPLLPEGLADGEDSDTVYTAGEGMLLNGTNLELALGGITPEKLAMDEDSLAFVTGGAMTSEDGMLRHRSQGTGSSMEFGRSSDGNAGLRLGGGVDSNCISFLRGGNLKSAIHADAVGTYWTIKPELFFLMRNEAGVDLMNVDGGGTVHLPSAESSLVIGGSGTAANDANAALIVKDHQGGQSIRLHRDGRASTGPLEASGTDSASALTVSSYSGTLIRAESVSGNVLTVESDGSLTSSGRITAGTGFEFADGTVQTTAFDGAVEWGDVTGVPGGLGGSQNEASGLWSVASGGHDNQVIGAYGTIGGGGAFPSTGGTGNRVFDDYGTIGGGGGNTTGDDDDDTQSSRFSTVAGGRFNDAIGAFSAIGGGVNNVASSDTATVGGGGANSANAPASAILGGSYNDANGVGSVVGGGYDNDANGENSTIGGGQYNRAEAFAATVPGGYGCHASQPYSLAAGFNARADHPGAIVLRAASSEWPGWVHSDRTDQIKLSAGSDIMMHARSSPDHAALTIKGFGDGEDLVTILDGQMPRFTLNSSGDLVISGTLEEGSDRNRKENIEALDHRAILDRVRELPVTKWNYIESPDREHIGPMAQDFHAAFGLGDDDTHISILDANGVALAAIKGLGDIVEEKDAEIAQLRDRLDRLEALVRQMAAGGDR